MSALSYLSVSRAPMVTRPLPSGRRATCLVRAGSSERCRLLHSGKLGASGSSGSNCWATDVARKTCSTQYIASFLSVCTVRTPEGPGIFKTL